MPSLGADMEAGTIVEWRVQPGDTVHRGDTVAVVDTEKSTIDVEVFEDGVVESLLVEPGVEVPVGEVLAVIGTGAAAPEPRKRRGAAPEPVPSQPAPPPSVTAPPPSPPVPEPARPPVPAVARADTGFVRASPRARRAATARGVDLAAVAGTGPGGAVLTVDLDGVTAAPAPPPTGPPTAEPAAPPSAARPPRHEKAGARQVIASLMARSKREIPHYYLATTIDLGPALAWMADRNGERPVEDRLVPAALLLKATALAAREVPVVNGSWEDGFRPAEAVHLGVAVSRRGGGLVAPAIHDADRRDVDDLMHALRDLVQRARSGRLRSSEMSDPTITVTNLGDQGVEEVFGVIYPPQVAMVGFGRVVERPWAVDGLLGVHPVVRATLAADHRASDGHDGARFLAAVDRLLQHPEDL